ncbi:hypothetical protein ONE63_005254 [Megalurothrips usitatus]|uniref:Calphotin-like n=1 Tax=Megalurothrips usitatus TaxID=439358 RepID=A0AAV7XYA6_9NEOP|nr:hypothetical protein ONE63_005254 [Megalurothrips usitatus]
MTDCCSASLRLPRSRYDQRQDGDQNVDARLQNFFVVVSPTAQLSSSGLSLLDLASKAVPLRLRPQGVVSAAEGLKQREEADQDQPDQEVKEVKSGRSVQSPLNAVAIPAAILQSPLAKLHPEVQVGGRALSVQEVLIAQSPVVELRSPPAPAPGAGAIPMLVAVPVPEVAPAPAPAPALLPMHPAAPEIIAPEAVVASEAAAAPETAAAPAQPIIAAPSIILAIPEAVAAPDAVAADAAAAPIVAPVEAAAAAVETNQIEPESSKLVWGSDGRLRGRA